jgi:hypothetical protein
LLLNFCSELVFDADLECVVDNVGGEHQEDDGYDTVKNVDFAG